MADPVNAVHSYGLHEKTLRQRGQISTIWAPFPTPAAAVQSARPSFLSSTRQQSTFNPSRVWGTRPPTALPPANRPKTWTIPYQPTPVNSSFARAFFAPVVSSTARPTFISASGPQAIPFVAESGAWAPTYITIEDPPNRPNTRTVPQVGKVPDSLVWGHFFEPPPPQDTKPRFVVGEAPYPHRSPASQVTRYFAWAALVNPSPRFLGTEPQRAVQVVSSVRRFYHPEATLPRFLIGNTAWSYVRESSVQKPQTAEAPPPQDPPLGPLFYVDPQFDARTRESWVYGQPPESVSPPPPAPDTGAHGGWIVRPPQKKRTSQKSLQQEVDELLESLGTVGTSPPDAAVEKRVIAKASTRLLEALARKHNARDDDDEDDDILLLS